MVKQRFFLAALLRDISPSLLGSPSLYAFSCAEAAVSVLPTTKGNSALQLRDSSVNPHARSAIDPFASPLRSQHSRPALLA